MAGYDRRQKWLILDTSLQLLTIWKILNSQTIQSSRIKKVLEKIVIFFFSTRSVVHPNCLSADLR